jgi:hypothetical protein
MSKIVCLSVRLLCIRRKNGYLSPSIRCPCQAHHPGVILCTCTIGQTVPRPSQLIPYVDPDCICCSSQCPCLSCLPEHLELKLPVCSFSGIPHSKYFPVWVLVPRADECRSKWSDPHLVTIPYPECLGRRGTIKMGCSQPFPVTIRSERVTRPMSNTPQQDSSPSPSSSMSGNRVDFTFHLFVGLHISYMFLPVPIHYSVVPALPATWEPQ